LIEGWEGLYPSLLPPSLTHLILFRNRIEGWKGLIPRALPDSLVVLDLGSHSAPFEPIEGLWLPDSLLSSYTNLRAERGSDYRKYTPYVERTKIREKMKRVFIDVTETAEIRMHTSDNEEVREWYSREFLEDEVYHELLDA